MPADPPVLAVEADRPLDTVGRDHRRLVRGRGGTGGQRNYPGFYWSSSSGTHVGYESWLERDEAMAMDVGPTVVAFAAQPFWLFWPEGGRVRSHAPDFFARKADGTGVVVDCRPASRVKPRDAVRFEATARACAAIGWGYRLVHGHEAVWLANVQWLAGYRHPRHLIEPVVAGLVEVSWSRSR